MKRFLKTFGLYLAIFAVAQLLSRLVLYTRVLDTSELDVPIAMSTYLFEDRGSRNPNAVAYLPRVRIDSEDVIDRLFSEIRDTALRGTKGPNLFERYPVFLMILEYGEGAQDTLMYIEVAANRKLTVHKTKDTYCAYITQGTYDLLTEAHREGQEKSPKES
ncbi:MAG: hypothetical protein ACOX3V_00885 [Bacillota bacterium]